MVTMKDIGKNVGTRLGNHLFQIAATIAIGAKYNTEVCFTNWRYSHFFKNSLNYKDIFTDINYSEYDYIKNIKLDTNINYNICGYFQSEKYFKEYEDVIRHFFTLTDEYQNIIDSYDMQNTCSIHIRRGDYVGGAIHGILTDRDVLIKYIKTGLDKICKSNETPRLIIFSDDINWCKNNLPFDNMEFIEGNEDIIDLFIMSKCENHIISNSTFSWWSAWLNKNINKKIICPTPWLLGNEFPLITDNIIPDEWIKINIFDLK